MNDALYINLGDIVATIFLLGVPAILFFVFYRAFKLDKKKASERLEKEKENTILLQKHLDELNERVKILETKLKDLNR
ncbi:MULTISPECIES: hypothetical protein [Planococcaceae]|uniref:Uncharacterized protein n=1 Tax=Planococcus halotolerans TaxID=2233542 RepID=A0A365L753_9BACL|nr:MULTISPECIES: hypothetical protein [Planococcaceae]RAZ81254.1 hypothetical protein DP120_02920 [Planococcus halotolerans]RLQ90085.1 hypothetical protein D9754_10095 [Planomicrobium sp. Y74]